MRERLVGGRGDGRPDSDFDPYELARGIEVEYEHTRDRAVAKEIAKDHLTEHPDYYKALARMEAGLVRRSNGTEPWEIILKQLGGANRIAMMTGARQFLHSDGGRSVQFKFPNRQRSKPNFVKITLAPNDTYTVRFARVGSTDVKELGTFTDVYVEQLRSLIERTTGLYLALRNPIESESEFKPHSPTRNVAPEDRAPEDRLPTNPAQRFISSHWGVPHTRVYQKSVPGVPNDIALVEMGKLLELWIRPSRAHKVDAMKVVFPYDADCHLVFTMDKAERLYCILPPKWREWCRQHLIHPNGQWYKLNEVVRAAGGRQADYLYLNDPRVQVLGRCTNIVYRTWKKGDDDEQGGSEYIHRFSEESKHEYEPYVAVDAEGYLWLCGGSYHCHDDGITD